MLGLKSGSQRIWDKGHNFIIDFIYPHNMDAVEAFVKMQNPIHGITARFLDDNITKGLVPFSKGIWFEKPSMSAVPDEDRLLARNIVAQYILSLGGVIRFQKVNGAGQIFILSNDGVFAWDLRGKSRVWPNDRGIVPTMREYKICDRPHVWVRHKTTMDAIKSFNIMKYGIKDIEYQKSPNSCAMFVLDGKSHCLPFGYIAELRTEFPLDVEQTVCFAIKQGAVVRLSYPIKRAIQTELNVIIRTANGMFWGDKPYYGSDSYHPTDEEVV